MTATNSNFDSGEMPGFRLWSRILLGTVVFVVMIGGVGGWMVTAELNGAVISPGMMVVDQEMKEVQHRDGGIISEIAVREGDTVRAGQVLLRLEDAQTRAELAIVQSQLVELVARKSRLLAEREGQSDIVFPDGFVAASADAAAIADGELRLFNGQQTNRRSQVQQLELGIVQIGEEVKGLDSQHQAKDDEIALVQEEYDRTQLLYDRGLTEIGKMTSIERELVRLRGEIGEISSASARAQTRISEIRLQILSIDETSRTEAQRELGFVNTSLNELRERENALEDRLSRIDVRAPIDGVVNELNIHTIGGVVSPAEVLVTLVPTAADLKVEFRLAPISIEQVSVNTPARVRFTSFNQRTTPELFGTVTYVSPATSRDTGTGETYYLGRIDIPAEEMAKLGDVDLVPGMPAEVYVQTEERTVASYLARPLVDQFNRAFRER
jgi:HlyD family secretion protein